MPALVTSAAGTGLRQCAAFGLTVDRDFLRRLLTVDRQRVPKWAAQGELLGRPSGPFPITS